jgi:predicted protein tyrosine phosphatase
MTTVYQPTIHVCSLAAVEVVSRQHNASHMITLLGPGADVETPQHIPTKHHLRLAFNDIDGPREGLVHPNALHIEQIISHAKGWDQKAPLLIHCWAGISRSTAAALITACALRPRVNEKEFARALRRASPTATPNPWMINLADQMLDRNGRLSEAVFEIGQGQLATEGAPFLLELAPHL